MAFIGRFLTAAPLDDDDGEDEAVIMRLSNTLRNASLLEDRRGAVMSLRSLAKGKPVLVGSRSLEVLLEALRRDGEDREMARCLVETLLALFEADADHQLAFGEMILKGEDNLAALLALLPDASVHLAFDLIQLLRSLSLSLPDRLCSGLIALPSALSSLVDLMGEGRMELVRGEVVQLLSRLVPCSMDAQQMVVFSGAIDVIMSMIEEEGEVALLKGSIVCEDGLALLCHLLSFHPANQKAFLEGSNALNRLIRLVDRSLKSQQAEQAKLPPSLFLLLATLLQSGLHPQLPTRMVQLGLMELMAGQAASGREEACHVLCLLIRENEQFTQRLYHIGSIPLSAQLIEQLGVNKGAMELLVTMIRQSPTIQLAMAASCHAPLPDAHLDASLLSLLLTLPDWRKGNLVAVRDAAELVALIAMGNADAAAILLRRDEAEGDSLVDRILHQLVQGQRLATGHAARMTLSYLMILVQLLGCMVGRVAANLLEDAQIILELLQLPSPLLQSLATALLGLLLLETRNNGLRDRLTPDLFLMRLNRLDDWLDSDEILPSFSSVIQQRKADIVSLFTGKQLKKETDQVQMLLGQLAEMEAERSELVELLARYERRLLELGEELEVCSEVRDQQPVQNALMQPFQSTFVQPTALTQITAPMQQPQSPQSKISNFVDV